MSSNSTTDTTSTINTLPTSVPSTSVPIAISISDGINKGTYATTIPGSVNTTTPTPNTYYDPRVISSTHYLETRPESPELKLCWRYGKTVKCISCIDLFFCILNSFTAWPMLFLSVMPALGYYGSKEYSFSKTSIYGIYCILLVMGRIIQLDFIFKNKYDDDSSLNTDGAKFLIFISLFVQVWITWLVYRFCNLLQKLSPTQLNTLRIGTYIPIETRVLYY
jgi:hypothetical protein